jgi:hypothetical protein
MKGLKLLAIRPLDGTNDRFKKNLQNQVIYKFYQDFKFKDQNDLDIIEVNDNLDVNDLRVIFPEANIDIYSSDKLNINVSAIVGPNGSGKSSLIDFYNLIFYYLSCSHFKTMVSTSEQLINNLRFTVHFVKEYYNEIIKFQGEVNSLKVDVSTPTEKLDEDQLKNTAESLISALDFRNLQGLKNLASIENELAFQEVIRRYTIEGTKHYGLLINYSSYQIEFVYKDLNRSVANKLKEIISDYEREKAFNRELDTEFNFQIFYQIENEIYKIEKIKDEVTFPQQEIFYTILLNYSLHSMNSNSLGEWVFKLFHKNDGYQTPNVINPYRYKGNIDVNSELELSKDRLTYNIIDQYSNKSTADILKRYKFKKFILTLKSDNHYSTDKLGFDYKNKQDFLEFLSTIPTPHRFEVKDGKNILDFCIGYLIKKFRKISSTYMNHFYTIDDFSGLDFPSQVDELEKWQVIKAKEFLISSNSHVARKFNQTFNFLIHYDFLVQKLDFIANWNIHEEIHLHEDELEKWIKLCQQGFDCKDTHELILNLFPSIFSVDIELEKNGNIIKLSDLSSGEQQYIFNINTVTYHINNLKTVETLNDTSIKKYNYVNIILDEVELYYHPEYQKRLVRDLLTEIEAIDSLGDLKNFNILFLTHSPFILSDIPNKNILRLEDGKPSSRKFEQTFGANIHDILANDFFLDGFMGEFAKEYIKDLIKDIENAPDNNLSEEKYIQFLDKINLIGEPVIKNSARSFLDKKFEEILVLTKKREELQRELLIVNKRLDNNGAN